MRTDFFIIILVLVCIISGCTKTPIPETDGNKIITSYTEHQISIKDYSGTISLTTGNQNPVSELFRIYVRYPDRYKVEHLESSNRQIRSVTILKGGEFIEHDLIRDVTKQHPEIDPEGNDATIRDYLGLMNRIIPRGNISYAGVGTLEKKPVFIIEIRPEKPQDTFRIRYYDQHFSLARVWIDQESWIVKRIDLFESDGTRQIASVKYEELHVNSGIPDTVFESKMNLEYIAVIPPTHPPVVTYPGVEYPS